MTLLPEQRDLAWVVTATALMWLPYTLSLIGRGGLMAAMGNRDAVPTLPAWAERAKRAHANAVENLVVFAPLVLLAALLEPANHVVALAARAYLVARLLHYLFYVAGIPVLRTLAFFAGWCATATVAFEVLT